MLHKPAKLIMQFNPAKGRTSMRKSFCLLVFLLLLILLLAGCGANIDSETRLDPKGSGKIVFTAQIPNDQLDKIEGGAQTLEETLKAVKPEALAMSPMTQDQNGAKIIFTLDFQSIDDLKAKTKQLTGKDMEISYEVTGTPFKPVITYINKAQVKDYFQWAIKAVADRKLVKDTSVTTNDYIGFTNAVLKFPFVDKAEAFDSGRASHEYDPMINSYQVQVDCSLANPKIKVAVGLNETVDKLVNDLWPGGVKKYIEDTTKTTVSYQDNTYNFTLEGKDLNDLNNKAQSIFSDVALTLQENPDSNIFIKKYRLHVAGNFAPLLNQNIKTPAIHITYPGAPADANWKPLPGGANYADFQTTVVNFNQNFIVHTPYYYLGIVLAAFLGLILLVLLYFYARRQAAHRARLALEAGTPVIEIAATSTGPVCPSCGRTATAGDKFCLYCGVPLSPQPVAGEDNLNNEERNDE